MPVRLLVSAYDHGAAEALAPVIRRAETDPRFVPVVVADGPAVRVFERTGIAADRISAPRVACFDSREVPLLLDSARRVLGDIEPDAVLTGCSGPDAGLDEALACEARPRLPTFTLQEFWGDVNPVLPGKAETFLVADAWAAELTRLRGITEAIPIGMTRHADDAPPPPRDIAREVLGVRRDEMVIVWFGQPLWTTPGYAPTVEAFGHAAAKLPGRKRAIYRPHPRDDAAERECALKALEAGGAAFEWRESDDLASLLAACDVAASGYSTVGVALAHLQRLADTPLGTPLFALFDPQLQAHYAQYTGLSSMPLSDMGAAITVNRASELGDSLARAISLEQREKVQRAALACLPDPASAPAQAMEAILQRTRKARRG